MLIFCKVTDAILATSGAIRSSTTTSLLNDFIPFEYVQTKTKMEFFGTPPSHPNYNWLVTTTQTIVTFGPPFCNHLKLIAIVDGRRRKVRNPDNNLTLDMYICDRR